MEENYYDFDETADKVKSELVGLSLATSQGEISIKELTDPIVITIPTNVNQQEFMDIEFTPDSSTNMIYYSLNVTQNAERMLATINPLDVPGFTYYLGYGFSPTEKLYNETGSLPKAGYDTDDEMAWTFFLNENIDESDLPMTVHLGLVPSGKA